MQTYSASVLVHQLDPDEAHLALIQQTRAAAWQTMLGLLAFVGAGFLWQAIRRAPAGYYTQGDVALLTLLAGAGAIFALSALAYYRKANQLWLTFEKQTCRQVRRNL